MRCLHFISVLGDLQEGHGFLTDTYFFSSRCQSPSSRAQKRGVRKAKAHKNPIFVLGDGCRELSSVAASPAGCIWQQCARQQIAATYHATCPRAYRRHACRHATCRQDLPAAHTAVALPPRNYRKKLPPARLPLGQPTAVHAAETYRPACCRNLLPRPTCRSYYRAYPRTTYLPLILPCIPPWLYRRGATAKNYRRVLPPRNYRRATYLPGILPRDESYRAMAPAPSGRVIRM